MGDEGRSGAIFQDINKLRKEKEPTPEEVEAKALAKLNDSKCADLVKNKKFEVLTLCVIVLNALMIGYDADYSARWGKPDNLYDKDKWGFPLMENLFAIYFTFEIVVRFFAFKFWSNLIDAWFIFDSILVLMMDIETYVLAFVASGGGMKQLSVLRLLRLLRITRMGKLMRFFPELQIIVKGMVAAVRSVGCTAILLVLIIYVFSIIFTSVWHQGSTPDKEVIELCEDGEGDPKACAQLFFGSMGKSMRALFIMGTILDDITACTDTIRATKGSTATLMLLVFIVFVLVSSFTMLNMLIGILCEVVQATSEGEKFKSSAAAVREAITGLFMTMDMDGNGIISKEEFLEMSKNKDVRAALTTLDVKPKHFRMYADLMFKPKDDGSTESITLQSLIDMIMRLRPGSKVTALDFASFSRSMNENHSDICNAVYRVDKLMALVMSKEGVLDGNELWQPAEEPTGAIEKISLQALEKVPDEDIINELQMRVGMNVDLPTPREGNMGELVDAFEHLCMPHDDETQAWSKETFTC